MGLVFHEDGLAKVKALLIWGQNCQRQLDQENRTVVIIDKGGHGKKQIIGELTANHLILLSINHDGVPSEIG